MPLKRLAEPTGSGTSGLRRLRTPADDATTPPEPETGSVWPLVAGGAALAGAGLVARNPTVAKNVTGRALEYANALRQQSMLSGLAPLKSMLGNVGAVVADAVEQRSLDPIKALLSNQTLQDIQTAYHGAAKLTPTGATVSLPGPTPGRIMQSVDIATRNALERAGRSPVDAEAAVFQSPLGRNYGPFGKTMEGNAIIDYLFPFRRTPFNQFAEGIKAMGGKTLGKDVPSAAGRTARNLYMGTGAVHGYATADDKAPLSVPLAIAGSARYGLPYGVGVLAGRALHGGRLPDSNAAGSVLPVSEYGLTQSIEDPLAPFTEPALLRTLRRLGGP